jgi:Protein of unknown function (DUF3108)
MIRFAFFVALLSAVFFCGVVSTRAAAPPATTPAVVDFKHLPWANGEALTYLISWDGLNAAQGTFVAHDQGTHWEFNLSLASLGLVDDFYPFTGYFWCILAPPPWRSVEYGEYRFEPRRTIKERTRIDYPGHQGTRENWIDCKTKTFPISGDSIEDVGTMLYRLRAMNWKPGDHCILHVYESDAEKEAIIDCQARETRAFGTWPSQTLLRIQALPGKGTHHRGGLMLWMTDDARHLPVHADLNFRYGTFSIDLTKAATVPSK